MSLASLAAQLNIASRQARNARAVPSLWLLSDAERLADPRPALRRLPPGSGFIFRHYETEGREALARELLALCRQRRIHFLLAGDWRMALRLRADGVHLPEYLAHRARAIHAALPGALVSAAAHHARAVHRARIYGADMVLLSPIFATQSHPGGAALGTVRFAAIARTSRLPVMALGGLNARNARRLKGSGAAGLAGISGII